MSVLVIAEHADGALRRMSWEAVAAGQELARALDIPCSAAVAGHNVSALAGELSSARLERVYAVEHQLLDAYTPDGYARAFELLVRHAAPRFVLLPHTYQVRDFAPKLATRFERVLLSDVIACRVEDGKALFTRQLFQGKLNADVSLGGEPPYFISVQAGAWRADQVSQGESQAETFVPELAAGAIRTRPEEPFQEAKRAVDLSTAELIVAVGRGIQDKDNLHLAEDLARALGAELAASRPICDNTWLPMERQVGSSGQTVSPKLYVAVGISGAIQHLVGMKGSRTVVAINKDPDAPIFDVADYGIVGDLFEVVPLLTAELRKAKGG
ncbi:MAG: electron transfer flavoprotein subunit alpha/FixB family protein [Bryobacteraceae bacterium]|nr:electron transfer flavoprotein subunit alpha/FixB family protein [Bryobacteraceae bacterium]